MEKEGSLLYEAPGNIQHQLSGLWLLFRYLVTYGRTKFPGRINNLYNPEIQRPKDHKAQRKTVSWRGQIQGPVAIQLNSGTFIMESLVSGCWPTWPTTVQKAQGRMQPEIQKCFWAGDRTLDTGLVGPLLVPLWSPASHTARGCRERHLFLAPSTQADKALSRAGEQQGKVAPPCKETSVCSTSLPWASLQHLLCKRTARSGGRCEKKIGIPPWMNKHENPEAIQSGCSWSWHTPAIQSCFSSCKFNKSSIKITSLIY